MITIGFSTREVDNKFIEHIKKTCGPKNIEIIPFENKGTHSLTEAYNILLEKSSNDIVVLCHDDIYFDKKGWGSKIVKHFSRNPEYGILGVAGSTNLPSSAKWWEDKSKMRGIVNHEHEGKKWESKYSNSSGNKLDEVVITDGLFIALIKSRLKNNFNEEVKGFHFYDVSFTFENHLSGVKVGIMYDVRITHRSIGQTNQEWENNRISIAKRYSEFLPKKILKDNHNKLKILFLCENFYKDKYEFLDKHDTIIISQNNNGVKNIFNIESVPGTILGDGILKIGPNRVTTVKNRLYRIKNINYDLILSDSIFLSNKIKCIYPNTKHIFIGPKQEVHNSVEFIDEINDNDLHLLSNRDVGKSRVKILTGFSNEGGSTFALSRMVNYFNEQGVSTTLYGPNDYHLKLCNSDLSENLSIESDDIIVTHFINLKERPKAKKVILFCHEKNIFEVSKVTPYWDEVIFLNQKHRSYHSDYNGKYTIIPNFKEFFKVEKTEDSNGVAGIIGSIDFNKQTHKSIERALGDGCKKILLFGSVTDDNYYRQYVKPLIDNEVVIEYGFIDNKPKMYSMIDVVYQSSLSEVASLVKEECEFTHTTFKGTNSINHDGESMNNEEVFSCWKKVLDL